MQVFAQIFVTQNYSCVRNLQAPSLVIDLGANGGFSSAYFLSIFPHAQVIAVEPDERTAALCKSNLGPYGNRALVLHGAAWSKRTKLRVVKGEYGDGREWFTQVHELDEGLNECDPSGNSVQAWDVGTLIEMSGHSEVDLLKVDIERAELSVFSESAGEWLPRVRNICIELHGKDCENVFFAALKDFNYQLEQFGELTVCRNLAAKKQALAEP
jgi:FkbM family methyltransferase